MFLCAMAKRPLTVSMRDEDLEALTEFAESRRLSKGDAIGVLLELLGEGDIQASTPMAELRKLGANPKLATARSVLVQAEKKKEVVPVEIVEDQVVKRYDDWELPSAPELEDGPPERVLDRSGDQSTDYDFDQTPGRRRR